MQIINADDFKEKVFDYSKNKEWKFAGSRPCVVDFFATWCGPCRMLSPVLEEVAKEYEGKIDVYKVDIDESGDLASVFGVQSVPTLLFVPANGKPSATTGVLPKEEIVNIVNEKLLK